MIRECAARDNEVDSALSQIIVCGGAVFFDAATLHQRPVLKFMLKEEMQKMPLMLDLVDPITMLQNCEVRDAA